MGTARTRRGSKPTLRAIAQVAGVSHVTVSLALRNDPRLTVATGQRVRGVARRLGYVPDPRVAELMGSLRLGRMGAPTTEIAFLSFKHPVYGVKDSPTAQRFFRGAEARAKQLGFRLERFVIDADSLTEERVSAILRARAIRGVLIAPLPKDVGALKLEWGRLAVVAFGHSLADPRVHRVSAHHAHTMRLALCELESRGYRRCGVYLREGLNARVDDAWLAMYYYHWHTSHPGVAPIPPLIAETWKRAQFESWFRAHRPDAVVTIQLPALEWLQALAPVPRAAGFAHLDWSEEMGDVAGIDQQSERVGAAGLEQVAAQLLQHEYGIPNNQKTIWSEGVWREGATARPPGV